MAQNSHQLKISRLVGLAAGVIIVAALYLAKDVLIPLALSVLFAFLLAPLVRRIERLKLGRVVSVLVVVCLASALAVGIGYVVTSQLVSLATQLPEYRDNIRHKAQVLRGHTGGGITKVAQTIKEIRQDLSTQPASATAPENETQRARSPVGLVET